MTKEEKREKERKELEELDKLLGTAPKRMMLPLARLAAAPKEEKKPAEAKKEEKKETKKEDGKKKKKSKKPKAPKPEDKKVPEPEAKELTPEERQMNAAKAATLRKEKEAKKHKGKLDDIKAEMAGRKVKAGKVKKLIEKTEYDL